MPAGNDVLPFAVFYVLYLRQGRLLLLRDGDIARVGHATKHLGLLGLEGLLGLGALLAQVDGGEVLLHDLVDLVGLRWRGSGAKRGETGSETG